MSEAKNKRGGARRGAGRKPSEIQRETMALYLRKGVGDILRAEAKEKKMSIGDIVGEFAESIERKRGRA